MTRRLAPRAVLAPLAALFVALLLGFARPSAAQTPVRASVRVAPTRVAVGGRVAYTLTLRGAPGRAFPTPPATAGLRAVQASPTSDATLQVNGDIQRELTWTFEAVRPGAARIGPFRVDLGGGRELNVQATSVTVASSPAPPAAPRGAGPPAARAPNERADLFARIELSAERVVVGQQVVAEVVLYFDPDLQPRQTLAASAWDAPGFWREELEVASTVPHPVTLGGRAFEAVTLARVALFPTRDGRLTLPPMRFAVDFLRLDPFGIDPNDPFAPFFAPFSGGLEEVDVEAPAVSLDVVPLPPGAPPSFSGAVGQFTLQGAPVASAAGVGEPVVVEVTVAGTGNVATVGAPTLATPRGADAFPPRDEADIDRTGPSIRGRRTFRYTLVPQGPGTLDVPPAVWTFFDPETGTYQTLQTDSARVAVTGTAASGPAAEPVAGPAAPLISEATWTRRGAPEGVLWGVLGIGLGVPAIALAVAAGLRRRRQAGLADTPENRRRQAPARAEAQLAEARAGVAAGTLAGPAGCAAAERAVHAFLADCFGVAAAGLDRRALAAALDAEAVPERARVLAVLAALDIGQYAPALSAAPPESVIEEARATLAAVSSAAEPARPRRVRRGARPAALAVLFMAGAAGAQTTEEADRLFALGTQLAAEGDAAGAEAAFAGAAAAGRAAGRVSAAVEHNLGTLALKRADAGQARLHTERAARLSPFDAGIATNAARARALARVPAETASARAWRTVRGVAGPTGLVALALGLAYGALGLALAARRRAAAVLGAIALVATGAAIAVLSEAPEGVVLTATALRAAPAPDAEPGPTVTPGALVQLGDQRGAWRGVRADGRDGWVLDRAVEALAP